MQWQEFTESFGWILLNSKFICVISTVPTYLGEWGERVNFGNGRVNFGNTVAEIQQKYEREREKVGERECMNFGNVITEILAARSACPSVCAIAKIGEEKKKWLPKSEEELKNKCYIHNIFTTFSQQITCD